MVVEDPKGFLSNLKGGVVIDEIQRVPDLPSYIQAAVDQDDKAGRFILTGSQQFEVIDSVNQSLAGRTAVLKLLPFTYDEVYGKRQVDLDEALFTGFYPRIHDCNLDPTDAMSFYVSTYIERDIRNFTRIRNLDQFERFIQICAAHVGQVINNTKLAGEIGVDAKTVSSWLSLLQASFIVFTIQPHFKNFKKRLIKQPKLYFYDSGLLCYLLGITKKIHLNRHPLRGQIFESYCISELVKRNHHQHAHSRFYFFRDNHGNEVDLLIDKSHKVDIFEIKSAATVSQSFFKGLDFYRNLNQQTNESYLIYGGSEEKMFRDHHILPHSQLSQVPL
jgi:hypothetical protein